jgi:hypothetical protein
MRRPVLFFVLILLSLQILTGPPLSAQTSTTAEPQPLNLPQWAKDLRRAEIVAFGSFPFTVFFATTIMDTTRYVNHGNDNRYAPWPLKGAGAVSMTSDEVGLTILSAVGGSLLISLADYIIVRYKRYKVEQEQLKLPKGDPIIIRRPYSLSESAVDENSREAEPGTTGEAAPAGTPTPNGTPETPNGVP